MACRRDGARRITPLRRVLILVVCGKPEYVEVDEYRAQNDCHCPLRIRVLLHRWARARTTQDIVQIHLRGHCSLGFKAAGCSAAAQLIKAAGECSKRKQQKMSIIASRGQGAGQNEPPIFAGLEGENIDWKRRRPGI